MKWSVYKTTNKINGKYYIGVHKGSNPNDSYLGSGDAIKTAIRKYGRESFSKEVISVFDNPDDAFLLESELVTKETINDKKCYNCKIGGIGGTGITPWNKGKRLPEELRKRISKALTGKARKKSSIEKAIKTRAGYAHSDETKEKMRLSNLGQTRSEDTRRKMSESAKRRKKHGNTGKKNKVITCPHCGKSGGAGVMMRWHFDRCRSAH